MKALLQTVWNNWKWKIVWLLVWDVALTILFIVYDSIKFNSVEWLNPILFNSFTLAVLIAFTLYEKLKKRP